MRSAQGARALVADEQHRALRPPEVVFQVMADAARIAHTGGGDNDFRRRVAVDGHGFLFRLADVQPRELQRVPAALHQGKGKNDGILLQIIYKYSKIYSYLPTSKEK